MSTYFNISDKIKLESVGLGLLDTYSGAAAAYSLRQLSSTYSGDAIVVRRASDNATQAIGFVNNELDTATLESFCSGTDGFVTTWYDQSGNVSDAVQTLASRQPQIVASGSTILEGGKPSIKAGVQYGYWLNTSVNLTSNDNSIFFVYKNEQGQGTANRFMGYSDSQFRYPNATEIGGYFDNVVNGPSVVQNTRYLFYYLFQANSIDVAKNNDASVSNSPLNYSPDTSQIFSIGTFNNLLNGIAGGQWQEFIYYPSDEDINRTNINLNINDFYNIY